MSIHNHENQIQFHQADNHQGGTLIDAMQGAQNGFCMGISLYTSSDYGKPGIHDDQEGFYVIEGSGTARVGDQEIPLCSGSGFIVPAGTPHSLKKDPAATVLKVLWAHGAI